MADDEETEYRVEYVLTRRLPGEDDFTEIGFGSSGAWESLDQCTHMVGSAITHNEWETEPGQPEPASIDPAGRS